MSKETGTIKLVASYRLGAKFGCNLNIGSNQTTGNQNSEQSISNQTNQMTPKQNSSYSPININDLIIKSPPNSQQLPKHIPDSTNQKPKSQQSNEKSQQTTDETNKFELSKAVSTTENKNAQPENVNEIDQNSTKIVTIEITFIRTNNNYTYITIAEKTKENGKTVYSFIKDNKKCKIIYDKNAKTQIKINEI